jgi:hypothetical protein
MIATIASGHADLSDVALLIAVVLAVIAAIGSAPRTALTPAYAMTFGWLAVAFLAFGWLVL